VLSVYSKLEAIPHDPASWSMKVRGASALSESLRARWDDALLYRKLATLREDVPDLPSLEAMAWQGADRDKLAALLEELGDGDSLMSRVHRFR